MNGFGDFEPADVFDADDYRIDWKLVARFRAAAIVIHLIRDDTERRAAFVMWARRWHLEAGR